MQCRSLKVQTEILRLLASNRNPESDVAGATAFNRDSARFSGGIDIFRDREELVAAASSGDTELLADHGFRVRWLRREPGIHSAIVQRQDESMRLEWVRDSDYRSFPALEDPLSGYRLHVADLAANKALAGAGRREPRDVLDLLYIHERFLPLGAVIWAAVAKDLGYSPESLITEIRRNARYLADDYADLDLTEPVDAVAVASSFRLALEEAEAFALAMPAGKEGLLFLSGGDPVQPDPRDLTPYVEHEGRRRGYWPSSPEIGSDMLRRAVRPPVGEQPTA